jgi:hypothetical protein
MTREHCVPKDLLQLACSTFATYTNSKSSINLRGKVDTQGYRLEFTGAMEAVVLALLQELQLPQDHYTNQKETK